VPVPAATRSRCTAALSPIRPPGPAFADAPLLFAPCLVPAGAATPAGGGAPAPQPTPAAGASPAAAAAEGQASQAAEAEPAGEEALAAGGALRTLLLALHVQGIGTAFAPAGPSGPALAAALELPDGWTPLGLVAAGRPA
jgi:nitroreductase